MILACLFQINFLKESPSETTLMTSLLLWGLCGGFILPSLINLTLKNVPSQFVGIASGMYNTLQQAASSIGICLIGGLFFTVAKSKNIVAAFHSGLYAEIICLLIIFALLVVIEDFKAKTN